MHIAFTAENNKQNAIPIHTVIASEFEKWITTQSTRVQQWVKSVQFIGESGTFCLIPSDETHVHSVVLGMSDADDFLAFGALPARLPEGQYDIVKNTFLTSSHHLFLAALGWGLGFYQFTQYKKPQLRLATLVLPAHIDATLLTHQLDAIYLSRDLINTPAEDMGPQEIENAVASVAKKHGAKVTVIKGEKLLSENYHAIHTVGRASHREPRMIDLHWGKNKNAPKVTLIGKGVCFDSGGLDLKTAAGMLLMKKDMAGSAMMLGLAHMIMSQELPVQLRLLIGAVDNAVSGNSYRPGDIIKTRSGKTVEITNTDAEGRLVLCDLLSEAAADHPDIIIDFATLTGAGRVALGEDIPAMYAQPQTIATELLNAAADVKDPIWQLPLVQTYKEKLRSEIADMINAVDSPYGGSITAALFLQAFVPDNLNWIHFDTCAWNAKAKPGRPAGGEVFGVRGVFNYLKNRYR